MLSTVEAAAGKSAAHSSQGGTNRGKMRAAGIGRRIFSPSPPSKLVRCVRRILFSKMASNPYFSLTVLFVAAVAFVLAPLALARLWAKVFSPAKPNAVKNSIYECGLVSKGDAWVQFHSAYYLYAIIFLVFDVESVFLLPFAVVFSGLGAAACGAMLVFVLLLVEGLAWAWAKGVLTWG